MHETITRRPVSELSHDDRTALWDQLRLPVAMVRVSRTMLPALGGVFLDHMPVGLICLLLAFVAHMVLRDLERLRPESLAASFAVPSRTELYRLYDVAGRLLYVGVGWSALVRCRRHTLRHGWWPEVVSVRVQAYPFRGLALAVEQYVIEHERPLHNTAPGRLTDRYWSHGWAYPTPVHADLPAIERTTR